MNDPVRSQREAGLLRVGLAVRRPVAPSWVYAVAVALLDTGIVDLTLIVSEPAAPASGSSGGTLWRAYRGLDRLLQRLVCRRSPDARATADLRHLGCTVAEESTADLDLVFAAVDESARRTLLQHGRVAVWWFDHDGHEVWERAGSGYAEVLVGASTTCCRLLAGTSGSGRPDVLRVARTATHPLFGAENRVQLLWKSIPLLVQKVRELHERAAVAAESTDLDDGLPGTSASAWATPHLGVRLARHTWRAAWFTARRVLCRDQWYLLRTTLAAGSVCAGEGISDLARELGSAKAIEPPDDCYWADPHIVPGDDSLLLVEEYPYADRRGRIALLQLDESGGVREARVVLERDYHLSYPSVFRLDGELYLVPESGEVCRVDAFRCTGYPWTWEYERTLIDGVRAVDSSIVEFGGRWWLFATVVQEPWLVPRDSMCIFSADDPLRGPWLPHPSNPVVCDAQRARPAGQPFVCDGRLFRPSQDCSGGYGSGMRINEVTVLSESQFEEHEVLAVTPAIHALAVGTHTLAVGRHTVVADAMRWRPRRIFHVRNRRDWVTLHD